MNKPEIIAVLLDRGIIPEDSVKKQDAPVKREIDPNTSLLDLLEIIQRVLKYET